MTPGLIQLITAIFGPLGVVMGAVGVKWLDRHKAASEISKMGYESDKMDAEAAQIISQTAVALVAPLQAQITQLAARVDHLEKENVMTLSKLQIAINHIRDLRSWISEHMPTKQPPSIPPSLDI